jgi:hypothetical protein
MITQMMITLMMTITSVTVIANIYCVVILYLSITS